MAVIDKYTSIDEAAVKCLIYSATLIHYILLSLQEGETKMKRFPKMPISGPRGIVAVSGDNPIASIRKP
jgi:hypothetical protein